MRPVESVSVKIGRSQKMLYSFDVFDTIITRKTAKPTGIFKIMQKELETDEVYSDISR